MKSVSHQILQLLQSLAYGGGIDKFIYCVGLPTSCYPNADGRKAATEGDIGVCRTDPQIWLQTLGLETIPCEAN